MNHFSCLLTFILMSSYMFFVTFRIWSVNSSQVWVVFHKCDTVPLDCISIPRWDFSSHIFQEIYKFYELWNNFYISFPAQHFLYQMSSACFRTTPSKSDCISPNIMVHQELNDLIVKISEEVLWTTYDGFIAFFFHTMPVHPFSLYSWEKWGPKNLNSLCWDSMN